MAGRDGQEIGLGGGALPAGLVRATLQAFGLDIVRGRWAAGSRLPGETELARHYGVGRNALREVVQILAGKGMIRTARRYGSSVCEQRHWTMLDPDVLAWRLADRHSFTRFQRDAAELRSLIEPAAAAMAALRADAEQRRGLVELARALVGADLETALQLNVDLHLAILDASRNELLAGLRTTYRVLLDALFRGSLQAVTGAHRYDPNPPLHQALATAISGGRAEEARHIVLAMLARGPLAAQALEADPTAWIGEPATVPAEPQAPERAWPSTKKK